MRITRLIAAGDDRVCRQPARVQNRRIDFGAQHFRSQHAPDQSSFLFRPRFAGREHFHRTGHALFGDRQSAAHQSQLVVRLVSRSGQKSPLAACTRMFISANSSA